MNLRSFVRKIIRANDGVSAVREAFSFARYGEEGKPIKHSTRTVTSENNSMERRKRLLTFIPKETPAGKEHRLMEESKRMKHMKQKNDRKNKTMVHNRTAKKSTAQNKGRGK